MVVAAAYVMETVVYVGDATKDMILEGVYHSIGKFNTLEYMGVWIITLVMTFLRYKHGKVGGGCGCSVYDGDGGQIPLWQ